MDINEALKKLREAAGALRLLLDMPGASQLANELLVSDMVSQFEAVDGWLSNSPMLPKVWEHPEYSCG